MKKTTFLIFCSVIIFLFIFSISWGKQSRDIYRKSIEKFNLADNHKASVFIDENYIFSNESLNKPSFIRYNYSTDEVVVFDGGNMCFYVFNKDGKFVRKFGKVGQGPGEYMSISALEIDNEGYIYILDTDNMRFTYFTSLGKYIYSFRLNKMIRPNRPTFRFRFFINEIDGNKEILFNFPETDYYISIYSLKGELLKEIGQIQDFKKYFPNNHPLTNYVFAVGYPFVDNSGKYCIILEMLFDIRKYDSKGIFLEENDIDAILGTEQKKYMINPIKQEFTYKYIHTPVHDVRISNGEIHLIFHIDYQDGQTMIQYLNYDLKLLGRYKIYIPKDVIEKRPAFFYFEPILNNDIYMGSSETSSIYKYQKKK